MYVEIGVGSLDVDAMNGIVGPSKESVMEEGPASLDNVDWGRVGLWPGPMGAVCRWNLTKVQRTARCVHFAGGADGQRC